MSKKVVIFAGPHGAGKTTFAREFLPAEAACPRFINADLIAAGLSPFAPEAAAQRAARLALREIHDCARRGESFAFESTLAGLSYLHLISQWQQAGYRVHLYFLDLGSVEASLARVAEQVRQGGQPIAEETVRRRFETGRRNFERHYRDAVDVWVKFDNLADVPRLIELGDNPTRVVTTGWSATAWQHRLTTTPSYAPAWRPRTYTDLDAIPDEEVRASHFALKRAAAVARRVALQTETALIVSRRGNRVVRLTPGRLRKQMDEALLA
jgi:predicted ABC-type ATPase